MYTNEKTGVRKITKSESVCILVQLFFYIALRGKKKFQLISDYTITFTLSRLLLKKIKENLSYNPLTNFDTTKTTTSTH